MRLHGHILAGKDQAVPGKILHGYAGANPISVAFRKSKIFASVACAAEHIRIRRSIDLDIFTCGNIRFLTQGNDSPVMQFRNIQGPRQIQIFASPVMGIHNIAADIVIRIRCGTENIRNILDQTLHPFIERNEVFPFLGKECAKRRGNIGKPGTGRIGVDLTAFRVLLDFYAFRMRVEQFGELKAGILQGFPQFFKPVRHSLDRLQRIVGLDGLRLQVHTAVLRNQRNAFMVRRVALQCDHSVIFNVAVQYPGGNGYLGTGALIHLVGLPRHRMMQAVHVGVGRQGHIAGRLVLIVLLLRGRSCSLQFYAACHVYIGRIAGIHHSHSGPGRHIFLSFLKGFLKPLQLALCNA